MLHVASGDLWAGAEVQIFHLLCALHARTDMIVSAVLLNRGELADRLRSAGVSVTVLDERAASAWQLLQSIRHEIRSSGAQVVHTHRFKENILGSIATRLSGHAISLRTVHGRPEYARGNSLRHALSRWLDAVTAPLQVGMVGVSRELCGYLQEEFSSRKVFHVPNGIDPAMIARAASEPSTYRSQPGVNVAFVGRLVRVKRVDLFLETAALLKAAQPGRYRFVIVGDGPLMEEMTGLAKRLGLIAEIDFLGFRSNSLSILRQMDCLLLTSDHEGLPMVALEALALGVPIVAHAVGGLPEALEGIAGNQLVTEHTPAGYATAIAAVTRLARPDTRGERHCQLPARYAISTSAQSYADMYRDLLAGQFVQG
jgi:glycosyltransferase involved in cell wall biosynthesis